MNVSKHATYQRLLALKDRFWHADEVLPQLEGLQPGDVQVGGQGGATGAGDTADLALLGRLAVRPRLVWGLAARVSHADQTWAGAGRRCSLKFPRPPGSAPFAPPSCLWQDFLPTMLAGLHIEALLHGNITAQEAEALARQVEAG